jgi:hypothetical protein
MKERAPELQADPQLQNYISSGRSQGLVTVEISRPTTASFPISSCSNGIMEL